MHEHAIERTEITSYDTVNYPSHAYQKTRPDYLAAVAKIFGISAVNVNKARVLELGCASGGNLIPMAAAFPESKCVGIDLSQSQVQDGNQQISMLKLKNIDLKHMSIMDITPDFGTFDYIIAHGVYSWVPEEVQDKIFSICQNNLSKNGIAYISYNTLPGWNMVQTVRDMMLLQSRRFSDPNAQITEARQMLNFVIENCSGNDTPYQKMLKNEAELLKNVDNHYLFHDHLEHHNSPCYFETFAQKAMEHQLHYIGDISLPSMFLGNHSQKAQEALSKLNNIIEQEQYLDFLSNRRFRSTLLCHNTLSVKRNVSPESFEGLAFTSLVKPENKKAISLKEDQAVVFTHLSNGGSFTSNHRYMTAILLVMSEQPSRFLDVDTISKTVCERLDEEVKHEDISTLFYANAPKFIFSNILDVSIQSSRACYELSDMPQAWFYARHLATTQDKVTTLNQSAVKLSEDMRFLMKYVDGEHTLDDMAEKMLVHFLSGELKMSEGDNAITDENTLRGKMNAVVQQRLHFFCQNALLVS